MTDHARLDTVCPNNHNLTVSFSRDDFEAALKADRLVLHCNTCEANWSKRSAKFENSSRNRDEFRPFGYIQP